MTYLDYNASAPLLPCVIERMQAALEADWKNPSSLHQYGQRAKNALEATRAELATLLGAERRWLYFTSGGSEANVMALRWLAEASKPCHIICSPIEHPSVRQTCAWLATQGVSVSWLPVHANGRVEAEALPELLREETRLVSVMAVNNETGVIQPIRALAKQLRRHQHQHVLLHCDAVQGWGRIKLHWREWGVDLLSLAAHKLGGPKGIGVLIVGEQAQIAPLIMGGSQERGLRAGTEAVFLAEGLLAAAAWHDQHGFALQRQLQQWRSELVAAFCAIPGFFRNGTAAMLSAEPAQIREACVVEAGCFSVANTLNIGFESIAAQSLLMALDLQGVAVSTGAACSSGAVEPSHVLLAMGCSEARARASLRISMGHATTAADIQHCEQAMQIALQQCSNGKRAASALS